MRSEALRLGLIGYPLGHSLSPTLHKAALKSVNLKGEYQLFPVQPLPAGGEELASLVARLRSGEIHGVNVTIPHKQTLLQHLDSLTEVASEIQAVNTISSDRDKLLGWNTDATGFLVDLSKSAPGLFLSGDITHPSVAAGRLALVLGAGGSARAVVYALTQAGFLVCVSARQLEQAKAITQFRKRKGEIKQGEANYDFPEAIELEDDSLQVLLQKYNIHLLVNTTPLGMYPDVNSCSWPGNIELPKESIVYDLVYNPTDTMLLRRAKSAGLPAYNGLGMLVEQAAQAFEIWTSRKPDRHAMMQAALASLQSIMS